MTSPLAPSMEPGPSLWSPDTVYRRPNSGLSGPARLGSKGFVWTVRELELLFPGGYKWKGIRNRSSYSILATPSEAWDVRTQQSREVSRGSQATLPTKGHRVSMVGFADGEVSVVPTQLCHCGAKTPIDNTRISDIGFQEGHIYENR